MENSPTLPGAVAERSLFSQRYFQANKESCTRLVGTFSADTSNDISGVEGCSKQ
jgi:hypothetical protein